MRKWILFCALVVGLAVASRNGDDAQSDVAPPPAAPPVSAFSAARCGTEPGVVELVVPDTAEARAAAADWCRQLGDTMTAVKQPGAGG
jgi:hypothetical protein